MYKMLIVDDEYYSREGTVRMLDWEKYDIEIVGTAKNGAEGMAMTEELKPDIILTDIRMKSMDGLSMIKEIKNKNIDCKFIVMSGYKLFEYAKKSLEEGVVAYLLKPIPQKDLIDALIKAKSLIQESKNGNISKRLEQSEAAVKGFIGGESLPDGIISYRIFMIKFEHASSSVDKADIYEQLLKCNENIFVCFSNNSKFIFMICNPTHDTALIRKIKNVLETFLGFHVHIGGSQIQAASDKENFSAALMQANLALQFHIYSNSDEEIIFYDEISKYDNNTIDNELIKYSHDIAYSVEACSKKSVHDTLRMVVERIKNKKYNPQVVCDWFKNLYINIDYRMKQLGYTESEFNNSKHQLNGINIYNGFSLSNMLQYTEDFCFHCIKLIEDSRIGNYEKTIKDVIVYIDNHYTDDISLEYLEKKFFIDLSYLSKLFKKETGKTYLQYITEKRIEKAKELMNNTDLNIYEIASKVSYNNAKYFSQLFKKVEGISPSDYRAKLLENKNKNS